MINKTWIRAALIRAVKTMAQTAVALLGTHTVGILEVDWLQVLSASAMAGILSILTSIAGLPEVDRFEELQTRFNADGLEGLEEVTEYEAADNSAEE